MKNKTNFKLHPQLKAIQANDITSQSGCHNQEKEGDPLRSFSNFFPLFSFFDVVQQKITQYEKQPIKQSKFFAKSFFPSALKRRDF